ncbi:MAG: FHA domain-containing protein [Deltaproteobacteria bacterium]|nr:FHA domain-containing protein [Deltaproteobacteria bacterium]MBW2722858.1 FHA domain-containing protein [Deltaproteobacteria bacterium]
MRHWLRSRKKKRTSPIERAEPGLELLVLEGADAGQKFTVDADEVVIGRRLTEAELPGGILLHDATVSARQAVIRHRDGRYVIDHLGGATNPTLVNGSSIESATLVPGSQIQIGRAVIDVRGRDGTALADFTQIYAPAEATRAADSARTGPTTEVIGVPTTEINLGEMAKSPLATAEIGWIEVREDPESPQSVRHPIELGRTSIGRSPDCDVCIRDLGVSRDHAELVWEGQSLVLYHKSGTNLTLVNRRQVTHRMVLRSGDEILLSGRVAATIHLDPAYQSETLDRAGASVHSSEPSGLRAVMEQKVAIERQIVEEFTVDGSFMDVDVVNSLGMKTNIKEPERIIISFERFRVYVAEIVSEFRGHVLNSNGDELMCFFESSFDAVCAGSAIFSRLDQFNQSENLLDMPFRFRIGVHSGQSLVDLKRGIAYSTTLDVAGHLQKLAPPDRMAISEQTISNLPAGLPFKSGGTLEREGFDYYILEGEIS